MPLRSALSSLAGLKFERSTLGGKSLVRSTAEKLIDRGDAVSVNPPEEIDQIAERIRQQLAVGEPPSNRDLLQSPWCIWNGSKPLAAEPDALAALLKVIAQIDRKSAFRRLAAAYVMGFDGGNPSTVAVGETLRAMAPKFGGPWGLADERFEIFVPASGPKRLAVGALQARKSPSEMLSEIGIGGLTSEARFSAEAHRRGLQVIAERAGWSLAERLERLRHWSLRPDGSLIFRTHKADFVNALVLPHAQTLPPKEEREAALAFLVRLFGDPRLKRGEWSAMETAASVVRRWIAGQTLSQFLDVVSEVAYEAQWKYRRAFWQAVFERELIEDAWVVFDQVGEQKARQMFDTGTEFGRWARSGNSKQIMPGQACLLLRIGSGLVAEWSHNRTCNIWHDADDESAPRMHQSSYRSGDVLVGSRRASGKTASFVHHSPATYSWQLKVADEIQKMTGVRIPNAAYSVN